MSSNEFDSEMKKMGVRRIVGGVTTKRNASRSTRATSTLGSESEDRIAAQARREEISGLEKERAEKEAEFQVEIQALQERAEHAEAQLESLKEKLILTQDAAEDAQQRNAALLSELEAPVGESMGLGLVLHERGILGKEEQSRAVEALLKRRLWSSIVHLLRVDRPQRLRERLDEGLILHCGGKLCPRPESAAWLKVEAGRCEVCGGKPLQVDALSDALLLHGVRTLVLHGGHPHSHAVLRDGLDSRIRFRTQSGNASLGTQEAASKNKGLELFWTGARANPAAQPRDGGDSVVVEEPSLAGLLSAVVLELGRR